MPDISRLLKEFHLCIALNTELCSKEQYPEKYSAGMLQPICGYHVKTEVKAGDDWKERIPFEAILGDGGSDVTEGYNPNADFRKNRLLALTGRHWVLTLE